MNCPKCGKPTLVLDSRPSPDNFIRRRRVCDTGHRFTTWESHWRPENTRERRVYKRDYDRQRYAAMSPELKQRAKLRRQAQIEARRTGEPVESICARWGVL